MIDLDTLNLTDLKELKDENIFRKQIIVPLLREMGVSRLEDMQGPDEQGIDIYFEWPDVFGMQKRYGIQLKIGDIGLQASKPSEKKNLKTIIDQMEMAFSKLINQTGSLIGIESNFINGFYVIINGKFNKQAREHLFHNRNKYPSLFVIDGEALHHLITHRRAIRMGHEIQNIIKSLPVED